MNLTSSNNADIFDESEIFDTWNNRARPQKLPSALRPVDEVAGETLPPVIYEAAKDYAERLQCPIDYLIVAMISAAGGVIGNRIGIFPYSKDETWQVFPALWGGIVGDPGTKKVRQFKLLI